LEDGQSGADEDGRVEISQIRPRARHPAGRVLGARPRDHANELVPSPADDRIIRSQPRLKGHEDTLQRAVAGRVAESVVGLLQPVYVDEGELEGTARALRALDL